jgi:hypothetical protein
MHIADINDGKIGFRQHNLKGQNKKVVYKILQFLYLQSKFSSSLLSFPLNQRAFYCIFPQKNAKNI